MTSATSTRRPWVSWLLNRWPTALAVPLGALIVTGSSLLEDGKQLLFLLPLEYLIVAKFRSQRATWPVIAALFPVALVLMEFDIPLSVAFSAVALAVLVWSVVDGDLSKSGKFRVQALGMLGFGALGLLTLAVEPGLARYLVAAGWLLHAAWDFVHFKLDQVVTRSYAEWCGVIDLVVAAGLILNV